MHPSVQFTLQKGSAARIATISAIKFGAATLAISSRANRDTARFPRSTARQRALYGSRSPLRACLRTFASQAQNNAADRQLTVLPSDSLEDSISLFVGVTNTEVLILSPLGGR